MAQNRKWHTKRILALVCLLLFLFILLSVGLSFGLWHTVLREKTIDNEDINQKEEKTIQGIVTESHFV